MEKLYTFVANETLALDGIHTVACPKGKPMPVPAELAKKLLKQGRIVEAGTEDPTYETKDTTTEVKTDEDPKDDEKKESKKDKNKKA